MKRDDFTLNEGTLKKERTFIKELLKLCEKHRMVLGASYIYKLDGGGLSTFNYLQKIELMREYLE